MRTIEDIEIARKYPQWLITPARKLLFRLAPHLQHGQIILEDGNERHVFGTVSRHIHLPLSCVCIIRRFMLMRFMGA